LFLWTAVPFLSVVGVFMAARQRRLGPLWVLVGACWGFVVLAAWSLGPFFVWSGLLLLAAGLTHAVAIRAGWSAAFIPAWFAVGFTGLCAVLFTFGQLRAAWFGGRIVAAPIVVTGTWVFAGLAALLTTLAVLQSRRLRVRTPRS
jgi:hypothetical protein